MWWKAGKHGAPPGCQQEQSKAFPAVTASFPSDNQAWWGSLGAGGCCRTHKAPTQWSWREQPLRQEKDPKLWGFHLGKEIGLLLLCCLLLTVIYGLNNNRCGMPGEELGCGHGGIASLLGGGGRKKWVISPSELLRFKWALAARTWWAGSVFQTCTLQMVLAMLPRLRPPR